MNEKIAKRLNSSPDWNAIREEFEGRLYHATVICKRHGITTSQLRYRREQDGWLRLRGRPPQPTDLIGRMLKVLDKQIWQLEKAVNEPIDKQANILATQVKTLDKLIELGAARPNVEPPTRKDMTELRAKLVERLEQFKSR